MINFKHILLVVLLAGSMTGCGRPDDQARLNDGSDELIRTIRSNSDFQQQVVASSEPVLVDFWAVWCPPCVAMNPVIKSVAARYAGSLGVAKVNVDDNRDLSAEYNIESIPTFMIFHKGKVVAQRIGGMGGEAFETWIREQLSLAGVEIEPSAAL